MAKRHSATPAKGRGRANVVYSHHVVSLLSQRDDLMTEIVACIRTRGSSPLIKKAGALLTRFWARADWQAREEILRTARWLLNVGLTQPAVAPAKAGKPKAGARANVAKRPRAKAKPLLRASSS